jgi:hypothetical protein
MKAILRISLAMAFLGILSIGTANAQPGRGGKYHHPGPGYGFRPDSCHIQLRVADLADELDLSEKQEAEILELHYAHLEKVKSFGNEYKNDCVGERDAHRAERAELIESVKKVLNKEQLEEYEKLMDRPGGPQGGHHRHWD